MFFLMATYIEKYPCAWVKIYYENLVQHHKSILKGDKSKESKTVTAKGGHEMHSIEVKEHSTVDKEISLVGNWGWQGRPPPEQLSYYQQK